MTPLIEQRAPASVVEIPESRRRRAGCGGLDKLDHRCGRLDKLDHRCGGLDKLDHRFAETTTTGRER